MFCSARKSAAVFSLTGTKLAAVRRNPETTKPGPFLSAPPSPSDVGVVGVTNVGVLGVEGLASSDCLLIPVPAAAADPRGVDGGLPAPALRVDRVPPNLPSPTISRLTSFGTLGYVGFGDVFFEVAAGTLGPNGVPPPVRFLLGVPEYLSVPYLEIPIPKVPAVPSPDALGTGVPGARTTASPPDSP
jgi:hypothetical protein